MTTAPPTAFGRRSLTVSRHHLKRTFDVVAAVAALILTAPISTVAAIAIRLTSPGPVLFTQTRVGLAGVPFRLYKLRTMRVDNDDTEHRQHLAQFVRGTAERRNGTFKVLDDPRVTAVGRVLRRYSIDELPQLWNVLRGDMSMVGPRPALPYEADLYDERSLQRLKVRPGLTGLWQVSGRADLTFGEMIDLDLRYVESQNIRLDLRIVAMTLPAVLNQRGAG